MNRSLAESIPIERRAPTTGRDARNELAGQRACLASVSRAGTDGVAHVARLLDRAIGDLTGAPPRTLDLDPAEGSGVSLLERARFGAQLGAVQLSRRADWILFNHVALARAQTFVPRLVRAPYGVFVHGVEVWTDSLPAHVSRALAGAAVRISNSEFTARRVAGMHPEIGPVVPCPLALLDDDAAVAGVVDDALLARVRRRSALIVGRMSSTERYKGHDQLIEVWDRVRREVAGAQLVIAGWGDDAPRLRERVDSAGLGEDVLFCGRVADATLAALYRRVRAFAMPSRGEGFGIVYLEAMRAGVPCLASSEDGAQDVVVDGETGFTVGARDTTAIARALVTLLSDDHVARTLGEAGRARYEKHFRYEHFRGRLGGILAGAFAASPTGER